MGFFDGHGQEYTGQQGLFQTSVASAADRRRMVYVFELEQLSFENVPKSEKVNQEKMANVAADEALSFISAQITAQKNKVPQPSWIADPKEFKNTLRQVLEASAKINHVSKGDVMNAAKGGHHDLPKVDEVDTRINEIQDKIKDMDGLVERIDSKFGRMLEVAQTPEELKVLKTLMGVKNVSDKDKLTLDAIFAVDPGLFKPKEKNGQEVPYEPGNIFHVLHAVEYILDHPAKALSKGMQLLGPDAIQKLRSMMDDKGPMPGHHMKPDMQPSMIAQNHMRPPPAPNIAPTLGLTPVAPAPAMSSG